MLGPVAYERDGGEVFLGRDWTRPEHEYSSSTGKAIDEQVQLLARSALQQAQELLRCRRDLLDELVCCSSSRKPSAVKNSGNG